MKFTTPVSSKTTFKGVYVHLPELFMMMVIFNILSSFNRKVKQDHCYKYVSFIIILVSFLSLKLEIRLKNYIQVSQIHMYSLKEWIC